MIEEAVERGWVFGTLMFGEAQVRIGHLVLGALKTPTLRNALFALSRQFERIKAEALADDFDKILDGLAGGRTPGHRRVGAWGRPARPAVPWRRPRWASRRRSPSSRST